MLSGPPNKVSGKATCSPEAGGQADPLLAGDGITSFHGSLPLAKAAPPIWSSLVPLGPEVKDSLLGIQSHLCGDMALDSEVWKGLDTALFTLFQ